MMPITGITIVEPTNAPTDTAPASTVSGAVVLNAAWIVNWAIVVIKGHQVIRALSLADHLARIP